MSGLTELDLQRLVDGEMSDDERREFLYRLDSDPQTWREVALAFVEDQVWCQKLKDAESVIGQQQERPMKTPTGVSHSRLKTVLQLAACLLLTLTVGYQWGRQNPRSERTGAEPIAAIPQPAGPDSDVASQPNPPPVTVANNQPQPACRLQLTAGGDGGVRTLELPVYESFQLDSDAWQLPNSESIELLNEELVEHGYRVDRQTNFLTGQMSDGRHVVVPIHRTSLCSAIQ